VKTRRHTPSPKRARDGRCPVSFRAGAAFTMIELLIVVAIIGILAAMVVPKLVLPEPSPEFLLGRAILEIQDRVTGEGTFRLRIADGRLVAERISREAAGWKETQLKWLPSAKGWRAESPQCYFFSDGSNTPWVLYLRREERERKFVLSVTGFLTEQPED